MKKSFFLAAGAGALSCFLLLGLVIDSNVNTSPEPQDEPQTELVDPLPELEPQEDPEEIARRLDEERERKQTIENTTRAWQELGTVFVRFGQTDFDNLSSMEDASLVFQNAVNSANSISTIYVDANVVRLIDDTAATFTGWHQLLDNYTQQAATIQGAPGYAAMDACIQGSVGADGFWDGVSRCLAGGTVSGVTSSLEAAQAMEQLDEQAAIRVNQLTQDTERLLGNIEEVEEYLNNQYGIRL